MIRRVLFTRAALASAILLLLAGALIVSHQTGQLQKIHIPTLRVPQGKQNQPEKAEEDAGPRIPNGPLPNLRVPVNRTLPVVTKDSPLAIVTLLDADYVAQDEDYYFISTRMMTYSLVHAEKSRIRNKNIDWIVAVTAGVEEWKRERLRQDGAYVEELDVVPLAKWMTIGDKRWSHQFDKLRLWEWTYYDRVLYIDADMIINGRIDELFYTERDCIYPRKTDLTRTVKGEPMPPDEYVFLSRPDYGMMGKWSHAVPPDQKKKSDYMNGGFWMAAPSMEMYKYLTDAMSSTANKFPFEWAEQDYLNYMFRRCYNKDGIYPNMDTRQCPLGSPQGPMPWSEMDFIWHSFYCNDQDLDIGVRSLHGKYWQPGDSRIHQMWHSLRKEMENALGRTGKEINDQD